jgi:hypothetical protein
MWPGRKRVLHVQPTLEGAAKGGTGKLILGSLIFIAAIALAIPSGGASLDAAVGAGPATTGTTIAAGLGATILETDITLGQVALAAPISRPSWRGSSAG